jgi:hypothetical protein
MNARISKVSNLARTALESAYIISEWIYTFVREGEIA